MTSKHILIVEDDPIMGESLQTRFELESYQSHLVTQVQQAKEALNNQTFLLVLCDYQLPDGTGAELADHLNQMPQHPPIVFMTAYSTVDRVIQLMKQGASDFFTKPFDIEKLIQRIHELLQTCVPAVQEVDNEQPLGVSPQLCRIQSLIEKVASQADSFLITGETGVGKERIAQFIHKIGQGGAKAD